MFAKVVADRYARAVLQSCPDLKTIDRVDIELSLLEETYCKSPETRAFFLNPKIPPKIKIQILEKALGDKVSDIILNLLKLLIEKHRQDIIPDISQRYNELTDNVRGVEKAVIVVATQLPVEIEDQLKKAVQRFSTRQVEVDVIIDPRIIGGVQVRLGDKVIDGSLSRRFEEIRRTMLAARVPRIIHEESGEQQEPV